MRHVLEHRFVDADQRVAAGGLHAQLLVLLHGPAAASLAVAAASILWSL
ncbi:MAG TPA: hypothetical protein VJ233_01530 [Hyphomicrobiaceae bacterium]|nr:hypothetical protein [Hyphomicrobiaceae bacterium]